MTDFRMKNVHMSNLQQSWTTELVCRLEKPALACNEVSLFDWIWASPWAKRFGLFLRVLEWIQKKLSAIAMWKQNRWAARNHSQEHYIPGSLDNISISLWGFLNMISCLFHQCEHGDWCNQHAQTQWKSRVFICLHICHRPRSSQTMRSLLVLGK